ncbi:MAG: TMEM175 family protein [Candidatus Saccharibacteria bacterium]
MKLPSQTKGELYSTRRIENLTDGVFAIAMTLLVLDLVVPQIGGVVSDGVLLEALKGLSSNFISFTLSFIILGLMWSVHTRQFEYITKVNDTLVVLNTARLFIVVLIPFTTSLNGHYPNLIIGQIFYPLNLFLLALVTYIQGVYASRHREFYREYSETNIRAGQNRSLVFLIVAGLVCLAIIPLGNMAFFGFLLIPLILRLPVFKKKTV